MARHIRLIRLIVHRKRQGSLPRCGSTISNRIQCAEAVNVKALTTTAAYAAPLVAMGDGLAFQKRAIRHRLKKRHRHPLAVLRCIRKNITFPTKRLTGS